MSIHKSEPEYIWDPQFKSPEYYPLVLSSTIDNPIQSFFDGPVPTIGDIVSLVCVKDETVNGTQNLYFKLRVTGHLES